MKSKRKRSGRKERLSFSHSVVVISGRVRLVHPIDTSGAGDIFHGAFCWPYTNGSKFMQALKYASEVATESYLHYGTRSWMEGAHNFSNLSSFLESF
jgi:sugar/nucleoside kinase (ribokinase family)